VSRADHLAVVLEAFDRNGFSAPIRAGPYRISAVAFPHRGAGLIAGCVQERQPPARDARYTTVVDCARPDNDRRVAAVLITGRDRTKCPASHPGLTSPRYKSGMTVAARSERHAIAMLVDETAVAFQLLCLSAAATTPLHGSCGRSAIGPTPGEA